MLTLLQASVDVFVQNAGNEGLIGRTFFFRLSLKTHQVSFRHANVYPFVLAKRVLCRSLMTTLFLGEGGNPYLSAGDDGLEKYAVLVFDKWHQPSIAVHVDNENTPAWISFRMGMFEYAQQVARLYVKHDVFEGNAAEFPQPLVFFSAFQLNRGTQRFQHNVCILEASYGVRIDFFPLCRDCLQRTPCAVMIEARAFAACIRGCDGFDRKDGHRCWQARAFSRRFVTR